jgi:polyhydroxybutyrate depolymerase
MGFFTPFFFLLIFLASCALPSAQLSERDLQNQLLHQDKKRDYILHLPKDYDQYQKLPLILVLHGGGGTAEGMFRLTFNGFNTLADQHHFFVAYPQGLEKSWNDDRKDPIAYAHQNKIDDVGFLRKLIHSLIKTYDIDPKRVFVTGISNGGFMSFRLGRELAGEIRAIAPVTATLPKDIQQEADQVAKTPVGLALFNGTEDPLVPYNGGEVTVFNQKRGKILSTEDTLKIWIKRNQCDPTPKKTEREDRDPKDETRVITFEYEGKTPDSKVVLYRIEGGGHTWPSGWQYFKQNLIGRVSKDIQACEEIWKFFSQFP